MQRILVEAHVASHACWCDIDMGALVHNVRAVRARLRPGCELIAIVKANAYGHGAVPVARTLAAAGVLAFAVGTVTEGEELRAAGIAAPIVLVGPVMAEEAAAVVAAGLVPTLSTHDQLAAFAAAARGRLPCHVEVDTGMQRHGVAAAHFGDFVHALRTRSRLLLHGVYTHFAGLGPDELPGMRAQLRLFEATLARMRDLGTVQRHACNTFGLLSLPEAHLDAVRPGGALYGFVKPGGEGLGLRPVLALRARCVGLREVAAGLPVGYGGTFRCARPTRLALLPIGYADGLLRELWQGSEVLVHGRRAPIVGLISINQTLVDVTDVPGVAVGDVFTLLGRDGDEQVRAEERARPVHSIYEVTALLRAGLPRRTVGG